MKGFWRQQQGSLHVWLREALREQKGQSGIQREQEMEIIEGTAKQEVVRTFVSKGLQE